MPMKWTWFSRLAARVPEIESPRPKVSLDTEAARAHNCYIAVTAPHVTVSVRGLLDGYAVVIVPLEEFADHVGPVAKKAASPRYRPA
jgi:hypothetical protein